MQPLEARTVFSFLSNRKWITPIDGRRIKLSHLRRDAGLKVASYGAVVERVAELSFRNPQFILVFRGQSGDWRNRAKNTSIQPRIFRSARGTTQPPSPTALRSRYALLARAEEALIGGYQAGGFIGLERLQRYRILRWAILQHYGICDTPLLDVTSSLRVAASFASMGGKDDGVLYVLAIPYLGGSVTAASEHGLQIMRLSSICPPEALRPHFQEGYLLGEYPELSSVLDKRHYHAYEIDFGLRLLCKFRLEPGDFWKDPLFPQIQKEALFPDRRDRFFAVAQKIRAGLV